MTEYLESMSTDIVIKVLMALALSVTFCGEMYGWQKRQVESLGTNEIRPSYRRNTPAIGYVSLIGLMILYEIVFDGSETARGEVLTELFGSFLHISLYYSVLLIVIGHLRNRISARTCAELWLFPSIAVCFLYGYVGKNDPLFVIKLPLNVLKIAVVVWFIGAVVVFLAYVGSHVHFRKKILEGAVPVEDPVILRVWQEQKEICHVEEDLGLVISDQIKTPLSIGLLRRTIRVVLPDRDYTKEELALIFRHELIHISRDDSGSKLYMAVCTALCWLNPLAWKAMERSAEDMELSCDETVLLGADEKTRQQYGTLILETAGDQRGFTTCLSATGRSLRYRLKHIVKERPIRSGILVTGVVMFLFFHDLRHCFCGL